MIAMQNITAKSSDLCTERRTNAADATGDDGDLEKDEEEGVVAVADVDKPDVLLCGLRYFSKKVQKIYPGMRRMSHRKGR